MTINVARALLDLKRTILPTTCKRVAISVVDPALDGIEWKYVYELIEIIFGDSDIKFFAYKYFCTNLLYTLEETETRDGQERLLENPHIMCFESEEENESGE